MIKRTPISLHYNALLVALIYKILPTLSLNFRTEVTFSILTALTYLSKLTATYSF